MSHQWLFMFTGALCQFRLRNERNHQGKLVLSLIQYSGKHYATRKLTQYRY